MVLFGRNSRVARAGARAVDAGRLLLRGDRGRARRAHLPHARLPAVGRLPRERRRAVADPGRRVARRRSTSSSRRANGEPFLPYKRDPRDARAAVGDPRHARARAPHRRPREGERDGQRLLRRREPRSDDAAARAEGRGHQGAGPRGRPPGGRRPARALVGRHVRPGARGRAPRARAAAGRSRMRTCAGSIRSRRTSATCSGATTACSFPR